MHRPFISPGRFTQRVAVRRGETHSLHGMLIGEGVALPHLVGEVYSELPKALVGLLFGEVTRAVVAGKLANRLLGHVVEKQTTMATVPRIADRPQDARRRGHQQLL